MTTTVINDSFRFKRNRLDVIGQENSQLKFKKFTDEDYFQSHDQANSKPLRILISTSDFVGPVKNGGVGTAYTHAAITLAEAGHAVTVLFSQIQNLYAGELDKWVAYYKEKGIEFIKLEKAQEELAVGILSDTAKRQYSIYEYLKKRDGDFDVIHGSEWNADLFFCLAAKQAGIYFQTTLFVTKVSSPYLWNAIGNGSPIVSISELNRIYMERRCVETADYVVGGSNYLLNWMLDQGYTLPANTFGQPNIYPKEHNLDDHTSSINISDLNEIIFFGRLEPRKGIQIFCDAITNGLAEKLNQHNIRITFIGKFRNDWLRPAKKLIEKTNDFCNAGVEVVDDMNHFQAIGYLTENKNNALVIMPSLMDNSPMGVYECLSNNIAFITSSAGGGKELIDPQDYNNCIFDPVPNAIDDLITQILTEEKFKKPSASFNFDENIEQWLKWHTTITNLNEKTDQKQVSDKKPLVSVCVAHYNRGALLLNTLESIYNQNYTNLEIIIVDDGSTDQESLTILDNIELLQKKFTTKIIRQKNKYLGAVRNTGVNNAQGEFIIFVDDDNELKPEAISTYVQVAKHTQADIITSFSDAFRASRPILESKPRRILFLGGNLATSIIKNSIGDSNMFARKSSVQQINGFSEHYKIGRDDQEFLVRANLSGLKISLIPEALYWYRINEVRMRSSQYNLYHGIERIAAAYTQNIDPDLGNIIRYAQGLSWSIGPWGPSSQRVNLIESNPSVVEKARTIVIDHPRLYKIAVKIYRIIKS